VNTAALRRQGASGRPRYTQLWWKLLGHGPNTSRCGQPIRVPAGLQPALAVTKNRVPAQKPREEGAGNLMLSVLGSTASVFAPFGKDDLAQCRATSRFPGFDVLGGSDRLRRRYASFIWPSHRRGQGDTREFTGLRISWRRKVPPNPKGPPRRQASQGHHGARGTQGEFSSRQQRLPKAGSAFAQHPRSMRPAARRPPAAGVCGPTGSAPPLGTGAAARLGAVGRH